MGDIIDVIFNLFHFFDVFSSVEKHWNAFKDNDSNSIKRIWSFIILLFLFLFFAVTLLFTGFILYEFILK